MNALQECLFVSQVDEFRQGLISGRELMRRLKLLIGDMRLASTALTELGYEVTELRASNKVLPVQPAMQQPQTPSASSGITIRPDEPSLFVENISFPSELGTVPGYLARQRREGRSPGVIVIHENKGLVEHIRDVARRLAMAGYVALAPDLLAPQGGTARFPSQEELQKALTLIQMESFLALLNASLDHLKSLPSVLPDRLGVTGFCFGGGLTWRFATMRKDLRAAVPFYGASPPLEDVPKIAAEVLAFYADQDERINAGVPALETALKSAGIRYQKVVYPGTKHAFHNDTGANYNPEAAKAAWALALSFFDRHLKREHPH